jgi:hypothetical protein
VKWEKPKTYQHPYVCDQNKGINYIHLDGDLHLTGTKTVYRKNEPYKNTMLTLTTDCYFGGQENPCYYRIKTVITAKNVVFWDVALCRTWVNRRFGGMYRSHLQGGIIRER